MSNFINLAGRNDFIDLRIRKSKSARGAFEIQIAARISGQRDQRAYIPREIGEKLLQNSGDAEIISDVIEDFRDQMESFGKACR